MSLLFLRIALEITWQAFKSFDQNGAMHSLTYSVSSMRNRYSEKIERVPCMEIAPETTPGIEGLFSHWEETMIWSFGRTVRYGIPVTAAE